MLTIDIKIFVMLVYISGISSFSGEDQETLSVKSPSSGHSSKLVGNKTKSTVAKPPYNWSSFSLKPRNKSFDVWRSSTIIITEPPHSRPLSGKPNVLKSTKEEIASIQGIQFILKKNYDTQNTELRFS